MEEEEEEDDEAPRRSEKEEEATKGELQSYVRTYTLPRLHKSIDLAPSSASCMCEEPLRDHLMLFLLFKPSPMRAHSSCSITVDHFMNTSSICSIACVITKCEIK